MKIHYSKIGVAVGASAILAGVVLFGRTLAVTGMTDAAAPEVPAASTEAAYLAEPKQDSPLRTPPSSDLGTAASPPASLTPTTSAKPAPPPKPTAKPSMPERKPAVSRQKRSATSTNGRPDFKLPFKCGQTWELTTYEGHSPDDKKVDFFNEDGTTSGQTVLASAAGEVIRLPSPGGVKIDHGNNWQTMYLHMSDIKVSVGDHVDAGDPIGEVGSVGTGVAHMHYEQLYDADGDGYASTEEMVNPTLEGKRYVLVPNTDAPVAESTNACS